MKKLLIILSALLFITGCEVESTSTSKPCPPVEEDYSDGIYFFVASYNNNGLRELKFDYIYEEDSSEIINTYCIKLDKTKVSDVIKLDINKLKLIRFYFTRKHRSDGVCALGNLDKLSFENFDNGLYVVEYFGHFYSEEDFLLCDTYIKKTKSIDYYLNNETFYDGYNIIFIKNNYYTASNFTYTRVVRINNADALIGYSIKYGDIIGFVINNPLKTECVLYDGTRQPIDYSIIKHGDSSIDLTQLGTGYFYTQIDNDGNFTTPVKLNSYKDILE